MCSLWDIQSLRQKRLLGDDRSYHTGSSKVDESKRIETEVGAWDAEGNDEEACRTSDCEIDPQSCCSVGFGCCGYEDADEVLSMDKRIKQTANISVE